MIRDNGKGFDPESLSQQPQKGTGLNNIRYRAKLIGAILTIDSRPWEGTQVQLSLPLKSALHA
jgi:signal transduction histidine kinase